MTLFVIMAVATILFGWVIIRYDFASQMAESLLENKSDAELVSGKDMVFWIYIVAGAATFLLSVGHMWATFTAGIDDGATYALRGFTAIAITVTVSAASWKYSSDQVRAVLPGVCIAAAMGFSAWTEIQQMGNLEDTRKHVRAGQSHAITQGVEVLKSLGPAQVAVPRGYTKAAAEVASIQTRIDNKNACTSCESASFADLRTALAEAKGRMGAAESTLAANQQSAAISAQGVLTGIQAVEQSEDNYSFGPRMLKRTFGIESMETATAIATVGTVIPFELAFFGLGALLAAYGIALKTRGVDPKLYKLVSGVSDVRLQEVQARVRRGEATMDELHDEISSRRREATGPVLPSAPGVDIPSDPGEVRRAVTVLKKAITSGVLWKVSQAGSGRAMMLLRQNNIGTNDEERRPVLVEAFANLVKSGTLTVNPKYTGPRSGVAQYLVNFDSVDTVVLPDHTRYEIRKLFSEYDFGVKIPQADLLSSLKGYEDQLRAMKVPVHELSEVHWQHIANDLQYHFEFEGPTKRGSGPSLATA